MTTKPKTISLYSGGGGLDYGFEAADSRPSPHSTLTTIRVKPSARTGGGRSSSAASSRRQLKRFWRPRA